MPWRSQQDSPTALERVVAVLCYLTMGLAGIVYIILSRSSSQSNFFRFHFLQSIILGILAILLNWAAGAAGFMVLPLFNLLDGVMPGTGGQIANGVGFLLANIMVAFSLLPIYGLIFAALGKFAEIPFISNVVRQQMR
jgi:uncharacterized membrane protein